MAQFEFLHDLPPLDTRPKAGDLIWISEVQPDGSYISKKYDASRLGGGSSLESTGLGSENVLRDDYRIFMEMQAGDPVETARIVPIADISVDPAKDTIGFSAVATSDFNQGGQIFNNQKNEIQALFEDPQPSSDQSAIYSEYNTTEEIALSAGQAAADVNYPLNNANNPTIELLANETALITFSAVDSSLFIGLLLNFNQIKLQVKRPHQAAFETIADLNTLSFGTINHLFKAAQPGPHEFRIKYIYQTGDAAADNYISPSFYTNAHDFSPLRFHFLRVEHFDFYGYGFGDLDIANRAFSYLETTFPEIANSGALPIRVNGLVVGDRILATIGVHAMRVAFPGQDANANRSQRMFRWRKVGESTWKTMAYKDQLDNINSNIGEFDVSSYNDEYRNSMLFVVPALADGGGPGDYEFSFILTVQDANTEIQNLFAYIQKLPASLNPQIVQATVHGQTDNLNHGNFELIPGQKGSEPEYLTFNLQVGQKIRIITSIGVNPNDSAYVMKADTALSMSVENGGWTGLDGSGNQTIIDTRRFNRRQSGNKTNRLYRVHDFVASRAGTHRFRASVRFVRLSGGQPVQAYFNTFSTIIGFRHDSPTSYKMGIRLNNDSANSLHNETGLTFVLPEKELPLRNKRVTASYTEFLSDSKVGNDLSPGVSESFMIKRANGTLFPFLDSLSRQQLVFTTWQNIKSVLSAELGSRDPYARELASRALLEAQREARGRVGSALPMQVVEGGEFYLTQPQGAVGARQDLNIALEITPEGEMRAGYQIHTFQRNYFGRPDIGTLNAGIVNLPIKVSKYQSTFRISRSQGLFTLNLFTDNESPVDKIVIDDAEHDLDRDSGSSLNPGLKALGIEGLAADFTSLRLNLKYENGTYHFKAAGNYRPAGKYRGINGQWVLVEPKIVQDGVFNLQAFRQNGVLTYRMVKAK